MADTRIRMPSSGGGLIRYFDEYKSKIQIPPTAVVVAIAIVIILGIFLNKGLL